MFFTLDSTNFYTLCDELAKRDADLAEIITRYGYPPLWSRPNTFETLVHIILEQQVSLASALAALNKLREKIKAITPENFIHLTDEELKACYFSRQKISYVRGLAEAIEKKQISLSALEKMSDDKIRAIMTSLKGIGSWTADIYLIMVLHHADIFPIGDIAAVTAVKAVKQLPKDISKEKITGHVQQYAPYRTIATMLFWHYYLSVRKK